MTRRTCSALCPFAFGGGTRRSLYDSLLAPGCPFGSGWQPSDDMASYSCERGVSDGDTSPKERRFCADFGFAWSLGSANRAPRAPLSDATVTRELNDKRESRFRR